MGGAIRGACRSLSSPWIAVAALAGSLAAAGAMMTPTSATPSTQEPSTQVHLTGDHAGSALFAERLMAPGESVVRCTAITVQGRSAGDAVVLLSADPQGELAPWLHTRIEVGADSGSRSCADFAGRTVYDGPLSGLASSASPTRSVDTGWRSTSPSRQLYRFTITLTDVPQAQGQQAEATFTWRLRQTATPAREAVRAGPEPQPSPTAAAIPAGPTGKPAPGQPGTSDRPAVPIPGADDPVLEAAILPATPSTRDQLQVLATQVARHAGLPLFLALLVLLFLAIQDRLDRRDPKLALAPLHAPSDLPFLDFPALDFPPLPELPSPSGVRP